VQRREPRLVSRDARFVGPEGLSFAVSLVSAGPLSGLVRVIATVEPSYAGLQGADKYKTPPSGPEAGSAIPFSVSVISTTHEMPRTRLAAPS